MRVLYNKDYKFIYLKENYIYFNINKKGNLYEVENNSNDVFCNYY